MIKKKMMDDKKVSYKTSRNNQRLDTVDDEEQTSNKGEQ